MPQIICTSPRAKFSKQIGGVKFFNSEVGLISEDVSPEKADEFMTQPTFFRLHEGELIEAPKKDAKGKRGGNGDPAMPPATGAQGQSQTQTQQPGF